LGVPGIVGSRRRASDSTCAASAKLVRMACSTPPVLLAFASCANVVSVPSNRVKFFNRFCSSLVSPPAASCPSAHAWHCWFRLPPFGPRSPAVAWGRPLIESNLSLPQEDHPAAHPTHPRIDRIIVGALRDGTDRRRHMRGFEGLCATSRKQYHRSHRSKAHSYIEAS